MNLQAAWIFFVKKAVGGDVNRKIFHIGKLFIQNCNNNNHTLNWLWRPGIVCRGIIVILHAFNESFQVKFFLWMSHGIFNSINVYSVFVNISLFLEWLNNHFLFCLTENDVKVQDENEYFLQLYIFSVSPWEDPNDDSNCFDCFICHPCHLWSWNIFFITSLLAKYFSVQSLTLRSFLFLYFKHFSQ